MTNRLGSVKICQWTRSGYKPVNLLDSVLGFVMHAAPVKDGRAIDLYCLPGIGVEECEVLCVVGRGGRYGEDVTLACTHSYKAN